MARIVNFSACSWVALLFFLAVFLCGPVLSEGSTNHDNLTTDQLVANYLNREHRNLPKNCPRVSESFGWICGATIRMPGNHLSRVCTSEDEPFFSGPLSLPNQHSFIGHIFTLQYGFPLERLVPCNEGNHSNPSRCATLSIYPSPESTFGGFDKMPPVPLPTELPSPPYERKGHTSSPSGFSDLDGEPVAFFYSEWIGDSSPPDACTLQTRIDDKHIGVSLAIPCSRMGDWRQSLRAAIAGVIRGIVREDENAACDALPESAIILISPWQSSKIESLTEWLNLRRKNMREN